MPSTDAKRGRRTGTAARRRNCGLKQEGKSQRVKYRRDAELRQYGEASANPTVRGRRLPRKAAKLQSVGARTGNRHRWSRRGSTGARVSHGQGTRQTGPVTSGEGALPARGGAEKRPRRLFSKNTGLCEAARRGIWPDTCPVPDEVKPRIEAPVNGGRNYNGPKVAKFLVGQVPTCTNGVTIWALSQP